MTKTPLVLGSLVSLMVFSQPALAQDVGGALHLALSTPLIGYSKSDTEIEGDGGGEAELTSSSTAWGLSDENGVTAHVGYGINNDLVLGGFLQLGSRSTTSEYEDEDEVDGDVFQLTLGPEIDYMFGGTTVRPFVGGGLGLLHLSSDGDAEGELSATGIGLKAGVGLRWFAARELSIDPMFQMGYVSASGEMEEPIEADLDISGWNIGITVAISGWVK